MANSSRLDDAADDVLAQIRQLREEVETLARDRIAPAVTEAAGQVADAACERADAAADKVRQHPIAAVLIAAGIGFLAGRLTR